MQIHEIGKTKRVKKKRIGRGGKRGAYSGKGQRGQASRAGRRFEPIIRGLIKRYHKLRGYNFNTIGDAKRIIGVDDLNQYFKSNEEVSPNSLIEKGLIKRIKGKNPKVKILGNGKLTKSLNIRNCLVPDSAKEIIEKAGGMIVEK